MKKNIIILPLLGLLAACSNPLDYQSGQPASVIAMNAMLRTAETPHTVWMSVSHVNELSTMENAKLTCYINDQLVAEVTEDLTEDEKHLQDAYFYRYYARPYRFNAEIKPGDKVRLEADWYGLHASVTAVAPQAPVLAAVDTVRTDKSPYSSEEATYSALLCRLRLEDRPGESNWYRLCVSYEADGKDGVGTPEESPAHWQGGMPFSYYKDEILNDGFRTPDDDKAMSSLFDLLSGHIYSKYCIFSDKAFADRTADVEINIFDDYLSRPWLVGAWEEDKEITRLRLKFDLLSLPYEEYHHLWSLTNAQNTGLDWSILSEPVRLPDNVQGGLGLVTVASVSSVTLDPVPVKELESKILPEAIEN